MNRIHHIIALLLLAFGATTAEASPWADVTSVNVSGREHQYTFAVTLKSPDTGCAQYANSWEVLNAKGALLYRRILAHSHRQEQPFTRSGGRVNACADETLYVRAHLYPSGYGGAVFVGSARNGFAIADAKTTRTVLAFDTKMPSTACAF